jgi:hypothetical protein
MLLVESQAGGSVGSEKSDKEYVTRMRGMRQREGGRLAQDRDSRVNNSLAGRGREGQEEERRQAGRLVDHVETTEKEGRAPLDDTQREGGREGGEGSEAQERDPGRAGRGREGEGKGIVLSGTSDEMWRCSRRSSFSWAPLVCSGSSSCPGTWPFSPPAS